MPTRKFTPEVVKTVLELRSQGQYVKEIVDRIKEVHGIEVTEGGVNKVLRTRGQTKDPKWTGSMEDRLQVLVHQGFTREQIANRLSTEFGVQVGKDAVTVAKARLGTKGRVFREWNAETSNTLRDLYEQGLTHEQIAEKLNERFGTSFTKGSINQQVLELGIANRNEGDVDWTDEMKEIVRECKAKNWTRQQTSDEIFRRTGTRVTNLAVGATVLSLGVQIGLHEGVRRLWTEPVEATLKGAWEEGKTSEEIREEIMRKHDTDVPVASIDQQLYKLKLRKRVFVDWKLVWPTVQRGIEEGDRPHQILEEIKNRHGIEISRQALYVKLFRHRRRKTKAVFGVQKIGQPPRRGVQPVQALQRFEDALKDLHMTDQADLKRHVSELGLPEKILQFLARNGVTNLEHMAKLTVAQVSTSLQNNHFKPFELERLSTALENEMLAADPTQVAAVRIPRTWTKTVAKFAKFQGKIREALMKLPESSGAENIPVEQLTTHHGLRNALSELGHTNLASMGGLDPRQLASLHERHGFKKTDLDELREGVRGHTVRLLQKHGFME